MDILEKLLKDIPLPKMAKVEQKFHAPEVKNVPTEVQKAIDQAEVLSRITKGDRVAIAVGSRGISNVEVLTREVIKAVKSVGGDPFIIPAMGSHGGASDEGQKEVLEDLGVTEHFVGAPIISSMEVVKVGELLNGLPVYVDKHAYEADQVIIINRIKAHTAFRGSVESGLLKMLTIGLGKQKGAEAAHLYGFKHMAEHVPEMAKIMLKNINFLFGLGSIENAYDHIAKVVALPAEKIIAEEPNLLIEAKSLMAKLMFDKIDVLVVDEIGKDISGDGMDPNITGRYATPYATGGPDVMRIVVLGLTNKTHGNANGLGMADVTTKAVVDSIEWHKGYANSLTSTVTNVVKVPMFMETNALAVKAAIKTCNAFDLNKLKVVRIKNTLDIKEIWVSEALLEEIKEKDQFKVLSEPTVMNY
ncbi:hypothetical protein BKP35_11430 [Anaerobacillus arseniciselenatis]|uniref:LarA-like N-terminal domain-containing protein n=1 Tax=Anaerobacillus arseniciselenatis TaxID=85682 RepID=A0A1S2LHK3_9BACI|nr:lactate racemase domain-containing protein [Anaerobacillus arseniciselenatis]OIJ11553.1 hypothetical protein BKP35_11430 [Anaerobacillus arseniciselenatis]